jgi:hypothetical protein
MLDAILQEARAFTSLEAVLRWAFARRPPAELVSVVTQDEFTHDVVIAIDPHTFLVFDTT